MLLQRAGSRATGGLGRAGSQGARAALRYSSAHASVCSSHVAVASWASSRRSGSGSVAHSAPFTCLGRRAEQTAPGCPPRAAAARWPQPAGQRASMRGTQSAEVCSTSLAPVKISVPTSVSRACCEGWHPGTGSHAWLPGPAAGRPQHKLHKKMTGSGGWGPPSPGCYSCRALASWHRRQQINPSRGIISCAPFAYQVPAGHQRCVHGLQQCTRPNSGHNGCLCRCAMYAP